MILSKEIVCSWSSIKQNEGQPLPLKALLAKQLNYDGVIHINVVYKRRCMFGPIRKYKTAKQLV